jgi:hypothetical protein
MRRNYQRSVSHYGRQPSNARGAWCVLFADLSFIFSECNLVQLDMRKRFRGNIIGSQFEYSPKAKNETTEPSTDTK